MQEGAATLERQGIGGAHLRGEWPDYFGFSTINLAGRRLCANSLEALWRLPARLIHTPPPQPAQGELDRRVRAVRRARALDKDLRFGQMGGQIRFFGGVVVSHALQRMGRAVPKAYRGGSTSQVGATEPQGYWRRGAFLQG